MNNYKTYNFINNAQMTDIKDNSKISKRNKNENENIIKIKEGKAKKMKI